MEGTDYLFTCAEVGAALAGFSALVVAFGHQASEEVASVFRGLVGSLVERSLFAVFLAFLPVLADGLGGSPAQTWFVSSGVLSVYIASMAVRSVRLRRRDPAFRSLVAGPTFSFLMVAGLIVLALQIVHALGLFVEQSVWWYLVGLTWLLISVAYTFYFAILRWSRSD